MKIIAIMEWDIKERAFRLIEADFIDRAKRIMRQRFKVLCARYPNNSFRLCEAEMSVLAQNIVHSDALSMMRIEDSRYVEER